MPTKGAVTHNMLSRPPINGGRCQGKETVYTENQRGVKGKCLSDAAATHHAASDGVYVLKFCRYHAPRLTSNPVAAGHAHPLRSEC